MTSRNSRNPIPKFFGAALTKSKPAPPVTSPPAMARSRLPVWLMAALLVLVTMALYWPATRSDFINLDDADAVTANVQVRNGLTWESVKWAFLNPMNSNWHPVTVLSHMVDCQLFGLKPSGHHLINVLFHALNAVLVFALLQQMTGATLRSLIVAALFAVHPLRVESVAWVAERKDVLSGFFGLLSLVFYARYAQRQIEDDREPKRRALSSSLSTFTSGNYWLVFLFYLLGLLSKPMLVTWPFVMLLLDYWPLRRFELPTLNSDPSRAGFRFSTTWRLVAEKLPFFALAALTSVVTFVVQKGGGALAAGENLPLGARSGNALISYWRYLGKLFWPMDLAVFYPHPGTWPLAKGLLAGVSILGISVFLMVQRRRYPFLLIGWLWFLGMLVPVIGLVQMGEQAMGDRYTYLPSLGVLILAVWGAYELTRRWRHHRMVLSVAGSVAIVLCMALTQQQLGHWQNSEALFRHALEVTENNYLAHFNLGMALDEKGQTDEAIRQYQEAIRLKPDYDYAYNNLGIALGEKDRPDEAIHQFQKAIRLNPNYATLRYNLGNFLYKQGRTDEAIEQYREAVELQPDLAQAHYNLGIALYEKGQTDPAIHQFQEVIRLRPDHAGARNSLGKISELNDKSNIRTVDPVKP